MTATAPRSPLPDGPRRDVMSIRVDRGLQALYRDTYERLGWTVDVRVRTLPGAPAVRMTMSRVRPSTSRPPDGGHAERTAAKALGELSRLEAATDAAAQAAFATAATIGTALLAGAVFAVLATQWPLSVPLGALGVLGLAYAGPVRRLVRARRSAELAPLVDRQYELIDALLATGGHSAAGRQAGAPA
jgi:hypothetical protein